VSFELPETDGAAPGLSSVWARARIEELDLTQHRGERSEVVREIQTLGLEHHLVTKHTSLVAVDVTPTRPEDEGLRTSAVPTNLPHGWTYEGIGQLPQTATPAPLHTLVALLSLLAAAALLRADRAWRAGDRS